MGWWSTAPQVTPTLHPDIHSELEKSAPYWNQSNCSAPAGTTLPLQSFPALWEHSCPSSHDSQSYHSPGLPLNFSEVAHTDSDEGARVEVPSHLQAGVVSLWSEGKAWVKGGGACMGWGRHCSPLHCFFPAWNCTGSPHLPVRPWPRSCQGLSPLVPSFQEAMALTHLS